MYYNRRAFVKVFGSSILSVGAAALPLEALAKEEELVKLTILHTNDVHSRIEPFPMDGGRYQGMGGAAKRASLIKKIRAQEKQVLLLDSGDILQGTPYFNFYGGELEFKLMSQMQYDVSTIGNHDFDGGIDGLLKQMTHANFPLVCANYDFSDTVLADKIPPYTIIQKGNIKIGVLGVGIALQGLVPEALYKNTQHLEPIAEANKTAAFLKNEAACDLVICLSHLGYQYDKEPDRVSDVHLAAQTENIDIILGGHTHTFLEKPVVLKNKKEEAVMISQVGWGGIVLGRLDVYFEQNTKKHCTTCKNTWLKG